MQLRTMKMLIIIIVVIKVIVIMFIVAKALASTSPILAMITIYAIPSIIQIGVEAAWSENFIPLLLHCDPVFTLLDSAYAGVAPRSTTLLKFALTVDHALCDQYSKFQYNKIRKNDVSVM